MIRDSHSSYIFHCGELLSQFIVNMYAKIEAEHLLFLQLNQNQPSRDYYMNLQDAMARDGDISNVGQQTILPSTFTGGPRYMHECTQDAMAYVCHYGRPDLFVTFTCNPNWKELLLGQAAYQHRDLVARVFCQKVIKLMHLITMAEIFGTVCCHMYTDMSVLMKKYHKANAWLNEPSWLQQMMTWVASIMT